MKFLNYRKDFLNNNSKLKDLYTTSSVLNEQNFVNDIAFGDSYLGRLINSTMQMFKTGIKMITIPVLLQLLKTRLSNMVDRISLEQMTKEYPTLYIKSCLEEIKNVCISSLPNEEKLKILIGWDGTTPMYDTTNPNGDIPGVYEKRRIILSSLVQDVYDKIAEPNNRLRLEKAFNANIIKAYLDTLSDFMDDLRRLTAGVKITSASDSSSAFKEHLLKILQNISQMNMSNENLKFKFLNYNSFLKENSEIDVDTYPNISKLIQLSNLLLSNIDKQDESTLKNSKEFKEFSELMKVLNESEFELLEKNNMITEIERLLGHKLQISNTPKQENLSERYSNYIELILDNKLNEWFTSTSGPQGSTTGTQGSTTGTQGTSGAQGSQGTSGTQGSTTGTQGSGGPQGTQGSTTSTTSSTTGPAEPKSVIDLWNKFFSEVDKILPAKLTIDEIDKLKNYKPEEVDFASSIVKKPDPLFKIIKIFEMANSIFTVEEIPSGRDGGAVWPVTYRRYKFVGSGQPGGHTKPGHGPWVHKPLFRQWTRGVIDILSDPQFSKIFPEVSSMNLTKESSYFQLNEKENLPDKTRQVPRNEILQEFILDLLDIKNQGDFSTFATRAIKRFFGLNIDSSNIISSKTTPIQSPPVDKEDIIPNAFLWESFKKTSFITDDLNQLYAFPITDNRKTKGSVECKIIFIRPLSINGDKVEVKFTINTQSEANITMNDPSNKGSKKVDLSIDRSSPVYYGVLLNDFVGGLKIVYVNVDNSNSKSFVADISNAPKPSESGKSIFEFYNRKMKTISGDKFIEKSKLVKYDDKKTKQTIKSTNSTISGEVLSDQFKNLNTGTKKLYDALVDLGRDKDFKYWR